MKRLTPHRARVHRTIEYQWAADHVLQIRSLIGRLRAHARRALTEKGYLTLGAVTRRDQAEALEAIAAKLDEKLKLRMGVRWWLDRAGCTLVELDTKNGRQT